MKASTVRSLFVIILVGLGILVFVGGPPPPQVDSAPAAGDTEEEWAATEVMSVNLAPKTIRLEAPAETAISSTQDDAIVRLPDKRIRRIIRDGKTVYEEELPPVRELLGPDTLLRSEIVNPTVEDLARVFPKWMEEFEAIPFDREWLATPQEQVRFLRFDHFRMVDGRFLVGLDFRADSQVTEDEADELIEAWSKLAHCLNRAEKIYGFVGLNRIVDVPGWQQLDADYDAVKVHLRDRDVYFTLSVLQPSSATLHQWYGGK